jgi:electron transport complex protein RnfD
VLAALAAEYAAQKLMGREITISDGSAALTGLLLGMCLPPALPLWMAALGAAFAIIIGKQAFGGLGCNVFTPAHIGRAMLLASFPAQMTTWVKPGGALDAMTTATGGSLDAMSGATPLAALKIAAHNLPPAEVMGAVSQSVSLGHLFLGNVAGSLGETCIPALLLGGSYLLWKKHIDWRIPVSYLGSVFAIMLVYGLFCGYGAEFALFHLLGGGLIIGAFFMATDWVTSPLTAGGRLLFGLGLGMVTSLIRLMGSYTEGVCYAILVMNMLTPLIDRYTGRRVFGRRDK